MQRTLFQAHSSMSLGEFGSLRFRTEGPFPCGQSAGPHFCRLTSHLGPHIWEPAIRQTLLTLQVSRIPL